MNEAVIPKLYYEVTLLTRDDSLKGLVDQIELLPLRHLQHTRHFHLRAPSRLGHPLLQDKGGCCVHRFDPEDAPLLGARNTGHLGVSLHKSSLPMLMRLDPSC